MRARQRFKPRRTGAGILQPSPSRGPFRQLAYSRVRIWRQQRAPCNRDNRVSDSRSNACFNLLGQSCTPPSRRGPASTVSRPPWCRRWF
jgi:hypothetical protein